MKEIRNEAYLEKEENRSFANDFFTKQIRQIEVTCIKVVRNRRRPISIIICSADGTRKHSIRKQRTKYLVRIWIEVEVGDIMVKCVKKEDRFEISIAEAIEVKDDVAEFRWIARYADYAEAMEEIKEEYKAACTIAFNRVMVHCKEE